MTTSFIHYNEGGGRGCLSDPQEGGGAAPQICGRGEGLPLRSEGGGGRGYPSDLLLYMKPV